MRVAILGLLRKKEILVYGVGLQEQILVRLEKYVAWFILNCTNIHGCLYYQVNFTAVVTISVIFSVSIYYCHKDWYVLVVI